jgi:hypothetical protein
MAEGKFIHCDGYRTSNCCGATLHDDCDLCPDCKEHCSTSCDGCEDYNECDNANKVEE